MVIRSYGSPVYRSDAPEFEGPRSCRSEKCQNSGDLFNFFDPEKTYLKLLQIF